MPALAMCKATSFTASASGAGATARLAHYRSGKVYRQRLGACARLVSRGQRREVKRCEGLASTLDPSVGGSNPPRARRPRTERLATGSNRQ
jgi:hypothetical protein